MARAKAKHKWYENCYVAFDKEAESAAFVQHKWLLGAIFLTCFSHLFYCLLFDRDRFTCPMWAAWSAGAFILFIGLSLIGHVRRTYFDKVKDNFTHISGFFGMHGISYGKVSEIDAVDIERFRAYEAHGNGHATRPRSSNRVALLWRGHRLIIADGGPGAKTAVARRLAKFIGCPLSIDGEMTETSNPAAKNEPTPQSP